MTSEHILSAFDRDLNAVQAHVVRLGGLVETAIHDAAHALETRDAALCDQVRARDSAIDALEEQINEEAARLIALRAPAASDMRTVMTVVKIAASLERMGDYAKNIAKRARILADVPPIDDAGGTIRRMSDFVEQMLRDVLDAYIRRDADLALEVRHRDAEVDEIYNTLFRTLLTHMVEDPHKITACMHLHFVAKNIERMGDHVTTIAEQVVYQVRGVMPDDERPKGDDTAVTPIDQAL
ncbi:phosphate transport system regulatory protein PhoU [Rhodobacter veldkampii DSM 11550]|uniref:Phosphate-specific transport system accessory protein PhoU n=1 Tax=Phaeovulum veldkampii DSM 11550 TaxID=1185920 RepID=A0A2T4JEE1_9RHOB|nr:phosphate signaling complex protein PhoU [Phaeovulum veldkampii]MBK5946929.1 phosphate transport system regulatory protein PhoU [Phaeovulum veldkampii DSM 11550]NCU20626.1 phosphate signaling complex protein PhoU [Candidatus Falkowbacteria bacterium]PTE16285.1 phosphate transport system regulatory protein PhoU [Phaeovulum veldkampii DSM 11550]TDQ57456.1 phosphate transport system protein [Phaeovulum veldkampii DSM 11550]